MNVGVLALQGAFIEHEACVNRLGYSCRQVRTPKDLEGLSHLILPGGESTTISALLLESGLLQPIFKASFARTLSIFGTCAGAILMARTILDAKKGQPTLGIMDLKVRRNAFGRQLASFKTSLDLAGIGQGIPAVFIRAPVIEEVGALVHVLGRLPGGEVVAAREDLFLATMFHPELTDDLRLHEYFLKMTPSIV